MRVYYVCDCIVAITLASFGTFAYDSIIDNVTEIFSSGFKIKILLLSTMN